MEFTEDSGHPTSAGLASTTAWAAADWLAKQYAYVGIHPSAAPRRWHARTRHHVVYRASEGLFVPTRTWQQALDSETVIAAWMTEPLVPEAPAAKQALGARARLYVPRAWLAEFGVQGKTRRTAGPAAAAEPGPEAVERRTQRLEQWTGSVGPASISTGPRPPTPLRATRWPRVLVAEVSQTPASLFWRLEGVDARGGLSLLNWGRHRLMGGPMDSLSSRLFAVSACAKSSREASIRARWLRLSLLVAHPNASEECHGQVAILVEVDHSGQTPSAFPMTATTESVLQESCGEGEMSVREWVLCTPAPPDFEAGRQAGSRNRPGRPTPTYAALAPSWCTMAEAEAAVAKTAAQLQIESISIEDT